MSDPDPDPLTISPAFDPQDDNNLREALKQGSLMLGELRTIALSPQKYYELYMQVWNELRHLPTQLRLSCLSVFECVLGLVHHQRR